MTKHEFGHGPESDRDTSIDVRIEALRQRIAAGMYHVSASNLADAIIGHMTQKQYRRAA